MNSNAPNPFQSPAELERDEPQKSFWGWRLIPAAILGLLGSSALVLAITSLIVLGRWLADRQPPWQWYVNPIIFFCMSGVWFQASWLYLQRSYRGAMLATVGGFAIPLGWTVFERIWLLI